MTAYRALLILMICSAASCGRGGDTAGDAVNTLPDTAVIAVARADAAALKSVGSDVRQAESLLFDIRAKEHFMRSRGLNATADLYISELKSLGAL